MDKRKNSAVADDAVVEMHGDVYLSALGGAFLMPRGGLVQFSKEKISVFHRRTFGFQG